MFISCTFRHEMLLFAYRYAVTGPKGFCFVTRFIGFYFVPRYDLLLFAYAFVCFYLSRLKTLLLSHEMWIGFYFVPRDVFLCCLAYDFVFTWAGSKGFCSLTECTWLLFCSSYYFHIPLFVCLFVFIWEGPKGFCSLARLIGFYFGSRVVLFAVSLRFSYLYGRFFTSPQGKSLIYQSVPRGVLFLICHCHCLRPLSLFEAIVCLFRRLI